VKPVAGKLGRLVLVGCALVAYGPGASAAPQQARAGQKRSVKPTPRKKWTLKQLKAPFQKPWWAAKKPQERKPERRLVNGWTIGRYAADDTGVIQMIRLLHQEIDRGLNDKWQTQFLFRLAELYERRDFYPEAYYHYRLVTKLTPGVRWNKLPTFPTSFKHLQDAALVGIARCCARVGLRRNALFFLKQLNTNDGYLLSLTGEVYDLVGSNKQSDSAYKVACGRAKYPPNGFGVTHPFFIRLNAVNMAYKHGNYGLAKQLAQPVVRRARDSYRWPQEKTCHDNISDVLEAIQRRRRVDLRRVKDGSYEGDGAGWETTIRMSVTVKKKKITKVTVVKHSEKRAFNAFTIVPDRMVAKQATRVDGVPDATATVAGIIMAVEKALTSPAALGAKRR
jgi:uncharacterized protein with FMN-binding domain